MERRAGNRSPNVGDAAAVLACQMDVDRPGVRSLRHYGTLGSTTLGSGALSRN
jgi:hypothetical protein